MQTWLVILNVVVVALNGILLTIVWVSGSFFKGYGMKKGEHVATTEDLQLILKEVKEVTRTQEEIKRQISGRQRLWELKREIAYDILKTTGTIGHLFAVICSKSETVLQPTTQQAYRLKLTDELSTLSVRFRESLETLWQLEGTSQIVYNIGIAYGLQRLVNAGAALQSPPSHRPKKNKAKLKQSSFRSVQRLLNCCRRNSRQTRRFLFRCSCSQALGG